MSRLKHREPFNYEAHRYAHDEDEGIGDTNALQVGNQGVGSADTNDVVFLTATPSSVDTSVGPVPNLYSVTYTATLTPPHWMDSSGNITVRGLYLFTYGLVWSAGAPTVNGVVELDGPNPGPVRYRPYRLYATGPGDNSDVIDIFSVQADDVPTPLTVRYTFDTLTPAGQSFSFPDAWVERLAYYGSDPAPGSPQ